MENVNWISVEDKLPNDREIVIIYWEYQGVKKITSGSYNAICDYWQHGGATQLKVSHWMPLPEPPSVS